MFWWCNWVCKWLWFYLLAVLNLLILVSGNFSDLKSMLSGISTAQLLSFGSCFHGLSLSRGRSSVHGIFQARVLEWVAISFSRGSSRPRDWTRVSRIAGRRVTTEPPGKPCGKEPTCKSRKHKRCRFDPWVSKLSWRRAWQPTPAVLPGESHGQRSMPVYPPQGHKGSWLKWQSTAHLFLSFHVQLFFSLWI